MKIANILTNLGLVVLSSGLGGCIVPSEKARFDDRPSLYWIDRSDDGFGDGDRGRPYDRRSEERYFAERLRNDERGRQRLQAREEAIRHRRFCDANPASWFCG